MRSPAMAPAILTVKAPRSCQGLIESHAHLSFASSVGRIIRERQLPPEENLLMIDALKASL